MIRSLLRRPPRLHVVLIAELVFALLLAAWPFHAFAQPATENTLPPPMYDASQRAQYQPQPMAPIGRDSITNHWCVVLATSTCQPYAQSVSSAPFTVVGAATPITTGASSANTAIPPTSALVVLTNSGANDLYYKLGASNAVAAASTDVWLGAGRSIAVAVGTNTYIAAISPAGASSLIVVGGTGGAPPLSGGGGSTGGTASLAPFTSDGQPASLSVTTTSSRVALPGSGTTAIIANAGSALVQCRFGTSSVTALTGDWTVYPGTYQVRAVPASTGYIACLTSSGTATVTAESGTGSPGGGIGANLLAPGIVVGDVAPGSARTASAPIKDGGACYTSDPAAQATGQIVEQTHDCLGKRVVIPALRLQKGIQTTTITSSASETTILTAGSTGVFNDVYGLVLDNTSASAGHCDIKDATSGTIRFSFDVAAGATGGFMLDAGSAVPQASAANNWTATCTSLASWKITVFDVATKG